MTPKSKIFFEDDVNKLSETLRSFLQNRKYHSIEKVEKKDKTEWHIKTFRKRKEPLKRCVIVNEKKKWHVEISIRSYERLLNSKKDYSELSAENDKLKKRIADLEEVNAQLKINDDEDKRLDNYKRNSTPVEKAVKEKSWKSENVLAHGHYGG